MLIFVAPTSAAAPSSTSSSDLLFVVVTVDEHPHHGVKIGLAHGLTGPVYVPLYTWRYRPRKYRDDGNYYYKFHRKPLLLSFIDFLLQNALVI